MKRLKRVSKSKTPEGAILKAAISYLARCPGEYWRNNTGAVRVQHPGGGVRFVRFGRKGSADITGLRPGGRRVEIEVKSTTGKLRPDQIKFKNMIESLGGEYYVIRSLDDLKSVGFIPA